MPSVQIKNVPPDVLETLRDQARVRGQSLQAFLLGLLHEQADPLVINRRIAAEVEADEDRARAAGTLKVATDPDATADLIREVREEREQHLEPLLMDRRAPHDRG